MTEDEAPPTEFVSKKTRDKLIKVGRGLVNPGRLNVRSTQVEVVENKLLERKPLFEHNLYIIAPI